MGSVGNGDQWVFLVGVGAFMVVTAHALSLGFDSFTDFRVASEAGDWELSWMALESS